MGKETSRSRKTLRIREYLSTENRILSSGWALLILKGLECILPHVSISLGIENKVCLRIGTYYGPMGTFKNSFSTI